MKINIAKASVAVLTLVVVLLLSMGVRSCHKGIDERYADHVRQWPYVLRAYMCGRYCDWEEVLIFRSAEECETAKRASTAEFVQCIKRSEHPQ